MPLYSFKCPECEAIDQVFRKINDRDRVHCCHACEDATYKLVPCARVLEAPMVVTDMPPYRSMIDGRMITSRSQHRDHLKAHGCIEVGNETKYLKPKEKIDLTPESKAARKQKIIEQVNHLKE